MSFGFMRSIWITLRATNYTAQALNDASRGLTKLQQAEVNLAKSSVQMGLMYAAMGAMVVQGMVGIMQMSDRGKKVWERFTESISPALGRLADAFANVLEAILPMITALMNLITINPVVTALVAGFAVFGATALLTLGSVKALSGGLELLKIKFGTTALAANQATLPLGMWTPAAMKATVATNAFKISIMGLSVSLKTLSVALFGILGVLEMLIAVKNILSGEGKGSDFGAIIGGILGAIGGFLVGGPVGAAIGIGLGASAGGIIGGAFQMGTSFVKKGGLAVVHEGEEIKSARESRVQSRFDRLQGTPTYHKSSWFVPITIGTVHTKADKETMVPLIKKALKETLDQKV